MRRLNSKYQDNDDKVGIDSEEDIDEILFLCKNEVGLTFNTNILRIALNMQEEKIASLIIAYFFSKVDEEMLLRSIKTS